MQRNMMPKGEMLWSAGAAFQGEWEGDCIYPHEAGSMTKLWISSLCLTEKKNLLP